MLLKNFLLIDIGRNKFINSILQCLSQTFPLTKYFLDLNNKRNIIMNKNNFQLSLEYLTLIEKLWNTHTEIFMYNPNSFIDYIDKMNYNNHKIENANELIILILEKLDKELSQQNNCIFIKNKKFNKYIRADAFENFFNEFKQKASIISEIFSDL